jgi:very-short-patch-repair endonuclease
VREWDWHRLCGNSGGRRGRTSAAWRLSCRMDGKGARPDQAIARAAERQHGVVSIGQLCAIGISEDAVHGRVRAGRLHRIHRGVYAVGHSALCQEARWMAAILACGRNSAMGSGMRDGVSDDEAAKQGCTARTVLDHWGAALSHRTAACLWALLPASGGPVDVSVPGDGGKRGRRGIRLHRCPTLSPAVVALHNGIPVTSPARTIADLRRVASARGKRGLISPRELRRAIRQADVLGLPLDPEANRDRTRSDLERAFLRLCRRNCLPTPEVNVRIGRHLVDFLWRDRRLVVETDGYRYHRGRAAFEDDRARDLALRALGCEVLRLSDRQLREEPESIAGVLKARLARFPPDTPETRHTAP